MPFDPTKPFATVPDETLESLTSPAPAAVKPVSTFDPSKPFTMVPDVAAPAGPAYDPSQPIQKIYDLDEFKNKTSEELLADKDFQPVQFTSQFAEQLRTDPDALKKLTDIYREREIKGTTLKEKAKAFFSGLIPAGKTLVGGVKQAAKTGFELSPLGQAKQALSGATGEQIAENNLKSGAELAASVENAVVGTSDLVRRSARNVAESSLGKVSGAALPYAVAGGNAKSLADQTDEEVRDRLFRDASGLKTVENAGQGNAAAMEWAGINADKLKEEHGIVLDPQVIQELSVVTDPINYLPLGPAVGVVTKIGGKLMTLVVATTVSAERAAQFAKVLNTATTIASKAAGGATKAAGTVVEGAGNLAEKTVGSFGGTVGGAGVGALIGHDLTSALGGAAIARAPKALQAAGRGLKGAGAVIAGEAAAPAAVQLAGQTLKAGALGALKGAAEGAVISLPFEIGARPEEEEHILGMVGLGSAIHGTTKAAGPVAGAAGRAAQNKLAQSIFKHVEQAPIADSPTYGTDAALDSVHSSSVKNLTPPVQKLVNWTRELIRSAGGELYVVDENTFGKSTGTKSALGYTVDIGETIAPDGSSKPLVRVLLNRNSDALGHEMFHALMSLDPKRAREFSKAAVNTMTPAQLHSFEQLYNTLRNNGLPESQWKTRLTPEKVGEEAAAEMFSRVYLAQDLSGVAKPLQQKAALFVSGILEKLGAPLGGVNKPRGQAGVSTLGVRPGVETVKKGQAWLADILKRSDETGTIGEPPILPETPTGPETPIPLELVRRKPAPGTPAPAPAPTPAPAPAPAPTPAPAPAPTPAPAPAPTPAPAPAPAPAPEPLPAPAPLPAGPRNIRTPRAGQNDFAAQRAEVTNIDKAKATAEATGDAEVISRVNELSAAMESGNPVVELEHSGVKAAGTDKAPSGRTARRTEQEAAYVAEGMGAAPADVRDTYQKTGVLTRFEIVAGKVQAIFMSLDKVIANVHKLVKESAAKGVADRLPYEVVDGKLTPDAWRQVVEDTKAYADNQANGYRGDGQKLIRPATDIGLSIPAENPAYNPRPISEERANFINATQGLNPPLTAREGKQSSTVMPGNVKGQILAEVNARQPEKPATIRPEDLKKQEFKSQPGRSVAETNPLRNELSAAGVPIRELIEVTERVNVKDIQKVTPRPDLEFKAPVTDTIRGGFLPSDEHSLVPVLETDDGQLFPGTGHADALRRAMSSHPEVLDKVMTAMENDAQHKFLDTKTGKVLDRAEAGEAVGAGGELQSEQLNKAATQRNLDNYGFKPEAPKVSGEFLPAEITNVEDAKKDPTIFWHGSPSGDLRGAANGLHLGTFQAAQEALNARIGTPVEGYWDGTREYGKTLLKGVSTLIKEKGDMTGYIAGSKLLKDHYPEGGRATYRDGSPVDLSAKPEIKPYKIVGEMTNRPETAMNDYRANGTMRAQQTRGRAVRGYFYKNEAEDAGSISAVVPNGGKHVLRVGDFMPSENPRAVKQAAFFDEESRQIHRGNYHGEALMNALAAKANENRLVDGFVTGEGEFLTRQQALDRAVEIGQVSRPDYEKEVATYNDLSKEFGYGDNSKKELETVNFARTKNFLPSPGELEKVKSGEKSGETFNRDGSVFSPGDRKLDVVTLASVNIPEKELTPARIQEFLSKYSEALKSDSIKPGVFRLANGDISLDLNVLVDQEHRKNTEAFAQANNQEAIFDLVKFESVPTKGDGQTVLKSPAEIADAVKKLERGEPVEISGKPSGDFLPTMAELEAKWAKADEEAKNKPAAKPGAVKGTAWILPDGEVKAMTAAYHENDLTQNRETYNKKFGTDIGAKPDVADRLDALNHGFVRVRYTPAKGEMKVEVNSRFWRGKTKAKIVEHLMNNADETDTVSIGLLNDRGNSVDYVEKAVFKADDKVGAIQDAIDEVVAPKTERGSAKLNVMDVKGKASKVVGPSSIERARNLPGDFLPGEEAPLLNLGLPSEEKLKQIRVKQRVSKSKEAFPEAMVPEYAKNEDGSFVLDETGKPKAKAVEYGLMDTPLAKAAANGVRGGEAREAAYTDALADKLVTAAKAAAKRPDLQAGAKWYSTTRTRLRGLLGDDSKFFSELLGATSARTPVATNFRFSVDAYNQFKAGKFADIIDKYREGKKLWESGKLPKEFPATEDTTRGQFLDWWVEKNDLKPRQSNGKLFGANSRSVLRVLDGSWREEVQGPKTPNFAGNLSGDTYSATIDVWAARLLHRLSNEGNPKRWRILPESETGVTDADFHLGQAAYRKAADTLGMKPDALQAVLWFYEKDRWEKNGWTRGAGALKSDFQSLLSEHERTPEGSLKKKTPQNELDFGLGIGDIKRKK